MPKILLVNEFDTRERFELSEEEAHDMLEYRVAFFCLADTLYLESNGSEPVGEPLIALHAVISKEEAFEQYVAAIKLVRSQTTSQAPQLPINPLTGKRDGILKILAKPKSIGDN